MASGREYKCDLDLEVDAEMNPPGLDGWTPKIAL